MPISRRTQAALARALANMSHAYLDALAFEFGVESQSGGYTREQKAIATIKAISSSAPDDSALTERMVDIATRVLGEPRVTSFIDGGEPAALKAGLELDGYGYVDGRVIPRYAGPVAPMEPASWLESELARRTMSVAAAHFRQAVDNFQRGNWESCNSQVRSFVEDLILNVGKLTGKPFADPGAVLQHLAQTGKLDPNEYQGAKALWNSLQDSGPHAGLSDEEEALYRLHSVAAWARCMIHRGFLGAA